LTYPLILGHENAALDLIADRFVDLPHWRPEIAERARELELELAELARTDAKARDEISSRLAALNSSWRELDALISAQFWRVAFHRVAEDEINYRRFFNINDLAGLRMELAPVFEHAHARVLQMLEAGEIDGLRIDHVDGLFDPKAYLGALRERVGRSPYLVVEKILAAHEHLRADWPVQGTTGYDYLNLSLGVLVDPSGEAAFTETYGAFAGAGDKFEEIARLCKLRIMDNEMASELSALGRAAARLARQSPMTADLTRAILQRAVKQVVANFPVYRTYVDLTGSPSEADRRDIAWAIARARRFDPDVHRSAFDFLQEVLSGETGRSPAIEISRTAARRFAMKLQQFSGPVLAKGVEDTAFYRYNRFLALNEVGGAPDRFGVAPSLFHKANAQRAEHWPHAMLATATHDTKRGEDARARLAVLSECPDEWGRQATSWSRVVRARLGDVEGRAPPDRDDEYMFYQMLVGSWPMDMLESVSPAAQEAYQARIEAALEKSLREGKKRSSWTAPNAEYEQTVRSFAREALSLGGNGFLSSFLPFVQRVARLGVQNSLAQTVMKLTSPGVPDIYQGCELWDLSLVDPDNRRAVDYRLREDLMAEVARSLLVVEDRRALFDRLMQDWRDGRVKLATIALLLAFRREHAEFFASADYQPIEIKGEEANWAVGYVRSRGDRRLAVLVARFPALREAAPNWRAEAELPAGPWFDLFRGRRLDAPGPLRELLEPLPFAVLTTP
jgi:(1->4)-alpha-D-glucan 1-alpha-D-glucosylmutase